jgi:hypothetical protein
MRSPVAEALIRRAASPGAPAPLLQGAAFRAAPRSRRGLRPWPRQAERRHRGPIGATKEGRRQPRPVSGRGGRLASHPPIAPSAAALNAQTRLPGRNTAGAVAALRPRTFGGHENAGRPHCDPEVVPPAGLEPARPCGQQILSLPRLPIPPRGPGSDLRRARGAVKRGRPVARRARMAGHAKQVPAPPRGASRKRASRPHAGRAPVVPGAPRRRRRSPRRSGPPAGPAR